MNTVIDSTADTAQYIEAEVDRILYAFAYTSPMQITFLFIILLSNFNILRQVVILGIPLLDVIIIMYTATKVKRVVSERTGFLILCALTTIFLLLVGIKMTSIPYG